LLDELNALRLPAPQGVSISGKPAGGGTTEIMWEIISRAAQS
jgi:hypothetical protein